MSQDNCEGGLPYWICGDEKCLILYGKKIAHTCRIIGLCEVNDELRQRKICHSYDTDVIRERGLNRSSFKIHRKNP